MGGADDVVEQLEALVFALRAEMQRAVREAQLPVSPMEMRALRHIAHHPGCTAADLVRHSGRDKAQVARLIQQLEQAGLARREPDPHDRRAQCLHATEAGQALHAQLHGYRREAARRLLARLAPQEQQQLGTLLARLRAAPEGDG